MTPTACSISQESLDTQPVVSDLSSVQEAAAVHRASEAGCEMCGRGKGCQVMVLEYSVAATVQDGAYRLVFPSTVHHDRSSAGLGGVPPRPWTLRPDFVDDNSTAPIRSVLTSAPTPS